MFRFQQGSPKRKSIPEFIYKTANQIKALSMETNIKTQDEVLN